MRILLIIITVLNFYGCSLKEDGLEKNKRFEIEETVFDSVKSLNVDKDLLISYENCVYENKKDENMVILLNNLIESEILNNKIKLKIDNKYDYKIKCDYKIINDKLLVSLKYINTKTQEILSKSFFIEKIKNEKRNNIEDNFRLIRIVEEKHN